MEKIVVDTSIIINGELTSLISRRMLDEAEMIIPNAVLHELQSQASQNKDYGLVGLNELKKIRKMSYDHKLKINVDGPVPSFDDIRLSRHGRVDSIIIDVAVKNNSTLYTSDHVQALTAEAQGVLVYYIKKEIKTEQLEFEKFFDDSTMSVHLKENVIPSAKKGKPGAFKLEELETEPLSRDYLIMIMNQILETARIDPQASLAISRAGASVVQYKNYRISVTHPPFSERYEVTIVRPIVRLTLDQYKTSEKLMERLSKQAEGILISGPPGSGKSTFASSLADFYSNKGKIVKTFESPRDLQVDQKITQYSPLDGSFENAADILLLVRPDYTIFDEVRRYSDFVVFSDLRLAGVGMVGVIHANTPLDAIQRFIGKIELGMIPHVLDTVVFVKDGAISNVYELELVIKVPAGMKEEDLARPVIEVRDFEEQKPQYEIYTFGEENIIMPVSKEDAAGEESTGIEKLAESKIKETIQRFDRRADVEIKSNNKITIKVDEDAMPNIIGRKGATINELEKTLGLSIDVQPKNAEDQQYWMEGKSAGSIPTFESDFDIIESGKSIILEVHDGNAGSFAEVYVRGQHVLSTKIAKKGRIKISRRSTAGKRIIDGATNKHDIKVVVHRR